VVELGHALLKKEARVVLAEASQGVAGVELKRPPGAMV
jgi:hypothetical protein